MLETALSTAYFYKTKINQKLWPSYFKIWPPYFECSGAGTATNCINTMVCSVPVLHVKTMVCCNKLPENNLDFANGP